MKKITFSMVSDWLFAAAVSFLVAFVIINYFVPRPFSFIYAGLAAAAFTLFTVKFSLYKRGKFIVGKKDEKLFAEVFSALNLMREKELADYFYGVFSALGENAKTCGNAVILPDRKIRAFFVYAFTPLTKTDAVRAFNKLQKNETAAIFCDSATEEVKEFAARFGGRIAIKTQAETFALIKKSGVFPTAKIPLLSERVKKAKLSVILDKRKAKTFFAFGVAFLALSFLAPIKTYYLLSGAVMLSFSLVLRLFGKTDAHGEKR